MKNLIPDKTIGEILDRTDIVAMISEHVILKEAGKNFKGLCPFHSEKTPSFSVSREKRIYYCFGCGTGGNVFKFLMEVQSISFLDAVKHLANRAGIPLPRNTSGYRLDPKQKERDTLRKINESATRYFQSLLKNPESGLDARNYLNSRHFDPEILDRYQIGWSAPTWRGLLNHAQKKSSVTLEQLVQSGLAVQKEDKSNVYDRFRGRVIFPIKDIHGNIIGFGGRSIREEDQPKYLNSPETLLYKKGETLFGIDQAKHAIRKEKQVLLVEGYFDQMRAAQHGIDHVVATCGTALKAKHADILRNYAKTAILFFDSDSAGESASRKGYLPLIERGFLSSGLDVKIIVLPKGHDPDSLIHEEGSEKFLERIQSAKPYMEHLFDSLIKEAPDKTPADKAKIAREIISLLKKIDNYVEGYAWIQKFTDWQEKFIDKTGIDDWAFLKDLKKAVSQNQIRLAETENDSASLLNPEKHVEERLIQLITTNKEAARAILLELDSGEFSDPALRTIAQACREKIDAGEDIKLDQLIDQTEDPKIKNILSRLGLEPLEFDSLERAIEECIRKFKNIRIELKIKDLKPQRDNAVNGGDVEQAEKLNAQIKELRTQRNEMYSALTH